MTRMPPLAKPAFAGLLALLLAAEWLMPGPAAQPPGQALAPADSTSDNIGDNIIGQWGDAVLVRPLFNPDRRPVTGYVAAPSYSLPRLSAIFIIHGIGSAVFSSGGQTSKLVTQGAALGAYQVITIYPDRVELLGPNGLVTLHPQFATAAAANPGQ